MTGADAEIPSAVRAVFIIDQDLRARMAASLSVDDVEDEGEAD
jgi:alkyl hydroperoxide reductase subunit AhpC